MPLPTPDVTLTGNIRSIFNSEPTGKEAIIVTLVNYGRNIPTVSGSLVLVDIVQTITPSDVDGSFAQTFFSNLIISPGPNITYYQFDFVNGDGEVALSVPFQFTTAGSFNLAALTPYGGPFLQPPFGNAIIANPNALQTIALFQLNLPSLGVKGPSTFYTNVVSNATATRTFTLPDANSNPVQPATAGAHQFVTGVSANGVISFAQPAYTDISGTPQLPITKSAVASNWIRSYDSTTGLFTASQPAFTDFTGTASTAQIPNLDASKITTGLIALARGGTGVDLSTSGGATQILAQDASHVISARTLIAADIPSIDASKITTGQIAIARGGTGSDLSATGGTSQVLKQVSVGGAVTVGQLAFTDLTGTASTAQVPSLDSSKITTGQIALARGGTGSDLSGTGGTSQVLKQSTLGGVITVGQLGFSDLTGSVSAAQLPNPTASTLGGIQSAAAQSHKWINSISTSGVPSLTQPAAADLSDGVTGSGTVVLSTSPTLTTPTLGAATATSITGLTGAFTPNAAGGTDIGSAAKPFANIYVGGSATNNIKVTGTATAARTVTLPDADSVTVRPNVGVSSQWVSSLLTNGTLIFTQPSAASLSDGTTGSGTVVLAISPTLITPVLGVATATSINKIAITAPVTGATLTIADGKTLTVGNTLTLAGTDGTTMTFQATGTVVNRDSTDTLTHKTIDTSGTGNHIQIAGVDLPASIGTSGQVLTNNSGSLAFTTVSGGGGSPGGVTNSIQYNTGSTFGGVSVLTPAGTLVTGAVFKSSIKNFSATGNSDIYTCPANKRAIITEITVFNGHASNSSTLVAMIKIGSTYYPATASTSVLAQSTGSRSATYILEAGETIAVNMTQQPFNVVASIMEFDNTSNLKSAKVTTPTLASGDNTIYTVPIGKTALVLNNTLTMCSGTQGTLTAGNNSGGNITAHFNVVLSGGSASSSNQMSAPVTLSTGTANSQSLTSFSIGAGDFISVNLSAGTSDQIAFVTVVEI
jgi:hypothetical protein